MVAAQAGRPWGSAWLHGLRRTKAGGARRSGREGGTGPVGWGVGRWSGLLGPLAGQGQRSGRADWARKENKKEIHSK
jgi:hypothetical protein